MFDVFSKVAGGGDSEESLPDASNDGSEGAAAEGIEGVRPADCTPADFRERAAALADRSDVPELDFTEAALPDVDAMTTGNHPVDDELTYGSYLGETLVREYGGEWVRDDGWGVRVALGDDETTVAVFDAGRMALGGTPVFEGVAERLHDQGDPYAEGTGASTATADVTATEGDAATEDHEAADEAMDGPDATDERGSEVADDAVDESDVIDEADSETADDTEDEAADEPDVIEDEEPGDVAAVDVDEADAVDAAAPASEPVADSTPTDGSETPSETADSDEDTAETADLAAVDEDEPAAEAAAVEGDSAGGADAEFDDGPEPAGDVTAGSPGSSTETLEGDGTADGDGTEGDDAPAPAADETSVSAADEDDDLTVESVDEPERIGSETTEDGTDADPADGTAGSDGTPEIVDGEDGGTDPTTEGSADATEEDTADPTAESPADRTAEAAGAETKDDEVDGTETAGTDDSQAAAEDDEAEESSVVDARSSELDLDDDGPTEGDFPRSPVAGPERGEGDGDDGEGSSLEEADDGDGDDAGATAIDDSDGAPVSAPEDGRADGIDRDAGVESGGHPAIDPETEFEPVSEAPAEETESAERDERILEETSDDETDDDVTSDGETSHDEPTADEGQDGAVDESVAVEDVPATRSPTASSTVDEVIGTPGGPDESDAIDADGADVALEDAADVATGDDEVTESENVGGAGIGDVDAADDEADASADVGPTGAVGPSRDDYEAPAIAFRNGWPERDFDFTPRSLARLDSFLDDQWDGRFRRGSLDGAATDPGAGSGPLLRVGAYVGEVLVQGYDGEWVAGEDGDPAIAVPGRHGRQETFPVFDVVRTSLVENARVAYAVDAMANRLDLEPHASGAEETGFALGEASPGTAASSADVITTILDRAEAFVEAWPGYDLDYRPASLVRLDNLVERELDSDAFRATTLGERTDTDALRLADRAAGASAYFAAVLVRHRDAQWEIGAEVALAVEGPAGQTRVVPFDGSVACLRGEDSFMRRYDRVHDAVERESRTPE